MAQSGTSLLLLSSLFFVSACSGTGGDWPNLSDPLPDASERERVLERAQPTKNSAPSTTERDNPMTVTVAIKLVTAVQADIENAQKKYLDVKNAITTAEGEEKEIAWHEAQLLLTRLSHTADKLDSIIYAKQMKSENVWARASQIKNTHDTYVAGERQKLNSLKP